MGKMAAILGGVRSGKSRLAQELVQKAKGLKKPAYLATVDSKRADAGLRERILEHRLRRPGAWPTFDASSQPLKALAQAAEKGCDALILDGLGLWVALQLRRPPAQIQKDMESFCAQARSRFKLSVLVLDEVGLGGIAMGRAARRFADLNGLANQSVCAAADQVYLAVGGVALRVQA